MNTCCKGKERCFTNEVIVSLLYGDFAFAGDAAISPEVIIDEGRKSWKFQDKGIASKYEKSSFPLLEEKKNRTATIHKGQAPGVPGH